MYTCTAQRGNFAVGFSTVGGSPKLQDTAAGYRKPPRYTVKSPYNSSAKLAHSGRSTKIVVKCGLIQYTRWEQYSEHTSITFLVLKKRKRGKQSLLFGISNLLFRPTQERETL